MAEKIKAGTPAEKCRGGRSFNCKHFEHQKGKTPDVYCFRCKARMGCSVCCEIPRELLCLVCDNWAHPLGVKHHGNIVKEKSLKIIAGLAREKSIPPVSPTLFSEPLEREKTAAEIRYERERREELRQQARKL